MIGYGYEPGGRHFRKLLKEHEDALKENVHLPQWINTDPPKEQEHVDE